MALRQMIACRKSSLLKTPRQFYSTTKDVPSYFQYERAIVGSLNNSFTHGSIKMELPKNPIDMSVARKHHHEYVNRLRKMLGTDKVAQIKPDDSYPDQVFVEDPAVVYDGKALLTRMKMPSRYGERIAMKEMLESLGLTVSEMKNPEAHLDGGDVLFTGREFLIGISSRTNKEGIEEFAKHFPSWPVAGINVERGSGVLHLKSMSSMCAIDTIAIGDSSAGRRAWAEIEAKAQFKYKKIAFPDDNGANCLFLNGIVLHPSKEDYPKSYEVWQSLDCEKIPLQNSEFIKADGSLTCCSILIN